MIKEINLHELYLLQKGLDENIAKIHHLTYEKTLSKRILALLVELGEFANETRCFKFWSLKGASPKEVVLDEYADALHFFLSIGLAIGQDDFTHIYQEMEEHRLTEGILKVYQDVVVFSVSKDGKDYEKAFHSFLNLLPLLGYEPEEMVEAYQKKLAVNYERQQNKY